MRKDVEDFISMLVSSGSWVRPPESFSWPGV
jgi:hypothetical protein